MLANWARATTTTTGTGNLTLSGVTDFPTLNDVFGTDRRFYYSILVDSTSAPLECGIAYLSASTTLVRDKILATYASSTYDDTSPSALSLASGTKLVIASPLQHSIVPGLPVVSTTGSSLTNKAVNNGAVSRILSSSNGYQFDAADRFNAFAFLHTYGGEVDAFKMHVTTAQATKIARVGLYYVSSDGAIGNLLVEGSSSFDLGSTGIKTSTFTARVIPPGWYYIATLSDATTAYCTGSGATKAGDVFVNSCPWGMLDSDTGVGGYKLSVSGVATAMPTTVTGLTFTVNLSVPQIVLRCV